jgi:hypothetical protein
MSEIPTPGGRLSPHCESSPLAIKRTSDSKSDGNLQMSWVRKTIAAWLDWYMGGLQMTPYLVLPSGWNNEK